MNEQREAIAKTIHTAVEVAGISDPYSLASTRELYERRVQADAVIAHLWEQAMQPEVVEAVAMVATDMLRETGRMDLVGCIVTATLKTLLGPRPTEQEAE